MRLIPVKIAVVVIAMFGFISVHALNAKSGHSTLPPITHEEVLGVHTEDHLSPIELKVTMMKRFEVRETDHLEMQLQLKNVTYGSSVLLGPDSRIRIRDVSGVEYLADGFNNFNSPDKDILLDPKELVHAHVEFTIPHGAEVRSLLYSDETSNIKAEIEI